MVFGREEEVDDFDDDGVEEEVQAAVYVVLGLGDDIYDFEFITFGAGRRICYGLVFGSTVEIALAMLLYHFDRKFPNGMTAEAAEDLEMTEVVGITRRRKDDLYF
ncbi:hypothetical protein LWI28_000821 [Acer negundo]|uniref:Cytochrome P450 n=1 Tax=Acer negundo TaxID=4023 RepID=A0AAD5IBG7_ACENE|nr:hypothetical protein LWI28_000821 [Acer negundo]